MIGHSERVVDVLKVQGALAVTEAGECAIGRHVEREAVAIDTMELLDCLTSLVIETLGSAHM